LFEEDQQPTIREYLESQEFTYLPNIDDAMEDVRAYYTTTQPIDTLPYLGIENAEFFENPDVEHALNELIAEGIQAEVEDIFDNADRERGFYVRDGIKDHIFNLYHTDPEKYDHWKLAEMFKLRVERIDAILAMKHFERTKYAKHEPFELFETKDGTVFGYDHQKFMELNFAPFENKQDLVGVDHYGKPSSYASYDPKYKYEDVSRSEGHGSGMVIEPKEIAQTKGHRPRKARIMITDLSEAKTGKIEVRVREKDGSYRYPTYDEWSTAVRQQRPLPRKIREKIIADKRQKGILREEVSEKKVLGKIRDYSDEWDEL